MNHHLLMWRVLWYFHRLLNITIFFNEEAHKYTNELGFTYTSTTTLIGKYCPKQDFNEIAKACERIGRNPNHKDYLKYKGKFAHQIIEEWNKITEESCAFGTIKHNFLECAVKNSNQFFINAKGFIDGQIYTIDDILFKHNYGRVKLEVFERSGVKEKYPIIYNILLGFHNLGYHIYAEIGVYDDTYGIPRKYTGPLNSNNRPTPLPVDFTDVNRVRRHLDNTTKPPFE